MFIIKNIIYKNNIFIGICKNDIRIYFGDEMNFMYAIIWGLNQKMQRFYNTISDVRTIPRFKKAVYLFKFRRKTASSCVAERLHSIHLLFYEP